MLTAHKPCDLTGCAPIYKSNTRNQSLPAQSFYHFLVYKVNVHLRIHFKQF